MTDHIAAVTIAVAGLVFNLFSVSAQGFEVAPFPAASTAEELSAVANRIEGQISVLVGVTTEATDGGDACGSDDVQRQVGRVKGIAEAIEKVLDK